MGFYFKLRILDSKEKIDHVVENKKSLDTIIKNGIMFADDEYDYQNILRHLKRLLKRFESWAQLEPSLRVMLNSLYTEQLKVLKRYVMKSLFWTQKVTIKPVRLHLQLVQKYLYRRF